MKLCKDCKHFRPFVYHVLFFKMTRNQYAKCAAKPDPIDGEPKAFCDIERMKYNDCGPEGKKWEAA